MTNLVVKLKGRATLEIKNLKDTAIMDGIKLLRNLGFEKYKIVDMVKNDNPYVHILQYELPSTSSVLSDHYRFEVVEKIIADEIELKVFLEETLGIPNADISRVTWLKRKIY